MRAKCLAVSALLAMSVVASAACGSSTDATGDAGANDAVDRAFVAQMVPHHEMALLMARAAQRNSERNRVRTLAANIVEIQSREIGQLKSAGERLGATVAPGPSHDEHGGHGDEDPMAANAKTLDISTDQMGMDTDMEALETARPFDSAFIDDMIRHHQGAIRMARAELDEGSDPELRQLAREIIEAQTAEIEQIDQWHEQWFGAPSPAGGVPAP